MFSYTIVTHTCLAETLSFRHHSLLHENRIKYILILPLSTINDLEYMDFNLLSCAHQMPVLTSMPMIIYPHPLHLYSHIQFPFTSQIHIPRYLSVLNHQAGTAFTSPVVRAAPTSRHPFPVLATFIAFPRFLFAADLSLSSAQVCEQTEQARLSVHPIFYPLI